MIDDKIPYHSEVISYQLGTHADMYTLTHCKKAPKLDYCFGMYFLNPKGIINIFPLNKYF
jgi:hypothetical protein